MAASVYDSNSQTATLTNEHPLVTVTAAGTYQLVVDAANLVNGEYLTLRIYGKARSTDSERLLHEMTYAHVQTCPLITSIPIVSPHHSKFTLEQNGGTGRAFPWAVYAL